MLRCDTQPKGRQPQVAPSMLRRVVRVAAEGCSCFARKRHWFAPRHACRHMSDRFRPPAPRMGPGHIYELQILSGAGPAAVAVGRGLHRPGVQLSRPRVLDTIEVKLSVDGPRSSRRGVLRRRDHVQRGRTVAWQAFAINDLRELPTSRASQPGRASGWPPLPTWSSTAALYPQRSALEIAG